MLSLRVGPDGSRLTPAEREEPFLRSGQYCRGRGAGLKASVGSCWEEGASHRGLLVPPAHPGLAPCPVAGSPWSGQGFCRNLSCLC